ncbi:MAG: MATE family efflux transporter, partial [Candidatus Muiribacteriaceae bacterium]
MQRLVEMNINKAVRKTAFPAIFSFMFLVFYEMVDAFWLDKLDYSTVFASLGAASFVTWSLYSLMNIVSAGVNSLVSQAAGAHLPEKYKRIAAEGYLLATGIGIVITALMFLSYERLFIMIGLEGRVLADACRYFSIMNAGFLIIFFYNVNTMIFNAHGDTGTAMKIQAFMFLLNCIIDPLFILGTGPFPMLGIKGAAVATIFSQTLGFGAGLIILRRRGYIGREGFVNILKPIYSSRIVRIGFPIALVNWVFAMVYPALTSIITKTGNINALGALNICHKLEGIPYFISMGFS